MALAHPNVTAAVLSVLALAIVVAKNGIGIFPSWPFLLHLAQHWSDPSVAPLLVPPADYLKANFVAAWLAGASGVKSPQSYIVFNLALTASALVVPFFMPIVRRSLQTSVLLFITIVGGPIAVVLTTWVGGYDAVSVIGITLAALARNPIIGAAGWLIVGLNHPSLALLGYLVWLPIVAVTSGRSKGLRKSLLGSIGLGAGIAFSTFVVDAWGGATNRWEWFIANGQGADFGGNLSILLPVLFGTVGVLWFVFLRPVFLRTIVVRILVVEIIALTALLPFFVLDITRVIALTILAPVLAWIAASESLHGSKTVGVANKQLLLPAVILPVPLVWEGNVIFGDPSSTLRVFEGLELPEWYPQ